jgi:hypothetical protein
MIEAGGHFMPSHSEIKLRHGQLVVIGKKNVS